MHVPTGALEELDQTTLLLLSLSVLCASHVQAMPRPCGGINQSLYCLRHDENIGPEDSGGRGRAAKHEAGCGRRECGTVLFRVHTCSSNSYIPLF